MWQIGTLCWHLLISVDICWHLLTSFIGCRCRLPSPGVSEGASRGRFSFHAPGQRPCNQLVLLGKPDVHHEVYHDVSDSCTLHASSLSGETWKAHESTWKHMKAHESLLFRQFENSLRKAHMQCSQRLTVRLDDCRDVFLMFMSMGWFEGTFAGNIRKPLIIYSKGKAMVSCRFSLKPIHCFWHRWDLFTASFFEKTLLKD